jgi:cytochrome P450
MSFAAAFVERAGEIGRKIGPAREKQITSLPDGPPWPTLVQFALWLRHPLELFRYCRARYGTPFTLSLSGLGNVVCFDDPDAIKDIFTGSSDTLHAGRANEPLRPLLGQSSLLLLDGPRHLRERKLLLPPFHGERMHRYGEAMHRITERELARWPLGAPHAIHGHTQAITLDVILETVFGFDEGPRMDTMRDAIADVTHAFSNPAVMIPQLQRELGGFSPWSRFLRTRGRTDDVISAHIRHRRSRGGGDDVLSLMLAARYEDDRPMTDRELRDELVTLLAAGHETTATALAWTLHLLAEHPAILARVHEEIDRAGGSIDPKIALPFLDAVAKESLRMRPVVVAVGRVLQDDEQIGGFRLPKGTMVSPNIYLSHFNPKSWTDPDRFDPDRFVDARTNPYTFFPFGGGVRRCLGMAFALYEMRIILGAILAKHTVRPAPGVRIRAERRNVTMTPSNGMPLVLESR